MFKVTERVKINVRVNMSKKLHTNYQFTALPCSAHTSGSALFPRLPVIHFIVVFLIYWNLKIAEVKPSMHALCLLKTATVFSPMIWGFWKLEQSVRVPSTWQELPLKWLQLKANAALLLWLIERRKKKRSKIQYVISWGTFFFYWYNVFGNSWTLTAFLKSRCFTLMAC